MFGKAVWFILLECVMRFLAAQDKGRKQVWTFFYCILTSHGYRGLQVYPTYCKCYVFAPASCSFGGVVRLR